MQPNREDVAKLAYQFYLEDGKLEGRADDHWARAEEFLRHPENHSDQNILAVPSEPELTRALDEKGRELDRDLPSDPRTDGDAVHQHVELAIDHGEKRQDVATLKKILKHLKGIERIEVDAKSARVNISFDARRTNPAAIHEAILNRGYQPSHLPQR
jgi:copper chaperone CopZ